MKREVPTETLRRAVEDSGLDYSTIARRLNWTQPNRARVLRTETPRRMVAEYGVTAGAVARCLGWTKPDTGRVRRAIGASSSYTYAGERRPILSTSYDRAVEIIRACGLDPVDYDV